LLSYHSCILEANNKKNNKPCCAVNILKYIDKDKIYKWDKKISWQIVKLNHIYRFVFQYYSLYKVFDNNYLPMYLYYWN